jgi:response regulator RpfG family c-di-GMP phosphodiesterase
MPRVLVVDGSHLMVWLVQTLVPDDVQVVQASRFADAQSLLISNPPDAAIFNLTPSTLEWSRLISLCHEHTPPIPFLLFTTLDGELPAELRLPSPPLAVVRKPARISDLRATLSQLLREVKPTTAGETPD